MNAKSLIGTLPTWEDIKTVIEPYMLPELILFAGLVIGVAFFARAIKLADAKWMRVTLNILMVVSSILVTGLIFVFAIVGTLEGIIL